MPRTRWPRRANSYVVRLPIAPMPATMTSYVFEESVIKLRLRGAGCSACVGMRISAGRLLRRWHRHARDFGSGFAQHRIERRPIMIHTAHDDAADRARRRDVHEGIAIENEQIRRAPDLDGAVSRGLVEETRATDRRRSSSAVDLLRFVTP